MPTLHVKDVPEQVYRAVRARARREKRSLAAEVRRILEESVNPERDVNDVVRSIERIRRAYPLSPKGPTVDSIVAQDRRR